MYIKILIKKIIYTTIQKQKVVIVNKLVIETRETDISSRNKINNKHATFKYKFFLVPWPSVVIIICQLRFIIQ